MTWRVVVGASAIGDDSIVPTLYQQKSYSYAIAILLVFFNR